MTHKELANELSKLGYELVGPSADIRYNIWRRAAVKGRREEREIFVTANIVVPDATAESILADAER